MSSQTDPKTIYGVMVGVVKNQQVYMCRRTDVLKHYPKKWQFVNGRLNNNEQSYDAAERVLRDWMGLEIHRKRLTSVGTMKVDEINHFYYIYLLNLDKDEIPANTCSRWRDDWRLFTLDKAIPLDVIPCIRGVLKKMERNLNKAKLSEANRSPKYPNGILSPRELEILKALDPKMTTVSR